MSPIYWLIIILAGAAVLGYRRAPLWQASLAALLLTAVIHLTGNGVSVLTWGAVIAVLAILNLKPLRRSLISAPLMAWFRKVLPPMSETEKEAIDAGSVWWDAQLFSGRPDWRALLDTAPADLSEEEQAFLDGPVEELCSVLDDWKINEELNDLPPEAWDIIRKHRFFGMIIPKSYGGLDFSARAQSEVVMKIASRGSAGAVTVMVPNSLGPGELLLHYGTEAQKDYYLPRLARGEEIPAFALTGPYAGSDAGSMPDEGIVCKGEFEGRETLGFRVNWDKRYITLGPICTVLGLAFKASDPDGLLGDKRDLGITCALIPSNTPGVTIGQRHDPAAAFQNGPNSGRDVFVPMEWVIGGREQVGKGWRMLMDCLSVGRAISLPALGTAAGKMASRTTGAYARIRKQFRTPIGRFEGIEEALARIGGVSYRMDAARRVTAGALDRGEKPSVLSAILKYQNTEGMRQVINDAMDVHAGRAVCRGPHNYLSSTYDTVPVAITVEGANILTRSMIIFGQGAIRCHPYVLREMQAAADPDKTRALRVFDNALLAHIGFSLSNMVRAWVMGLSGARFAGVPDIGSKTTYLRRLTRMSAAFAFAADVAMLTLGGDLKRREKLSGRFADILSHLYLASAVIKQHEDDGRPREDLPLAEWALEDSLFTIQERLAEICSNFPNRAVGTLLRLVTLPLGQRLRRPSDRLGARAAGLLLEPGEARERLTSGMYFALRADDPVGLMELTLHKVMAAEPIERKLRKSLKREVAPFNFESLLAEGQDRGVINDIEAQAVREAMELTREAIRVDTFGEPRGSEAAEVRATG
ncbi:MAG: acyl-CoA dehydrogenase [Gammaproteobacteria bacterium]|jgi:acyl-CoA dehydrogenase